MLVPYQNADSADFERITEVLSHWGSKEIYESWLTHEIDKYILDCNPNKIIDLLVEVGVLIRIDIGSTLWFHNAHSMDLDQAIKTATMAIAEKDCDGEVEKINNGFCEVWVGLVLDLVKKDKPTAGWWIEQDPRFDHDSYESEMVAHCVLWRDGKYYDCLSPGGIMDPLELACAPGAPISITREIAEVMKRGKPPQLWNEAKHDII